MLIDHLCIFLKIVGSFLVGLFFFSSLSFRSSLDSFDKKYFLPICSLFIHFLKTVFQWEEGINLMKQINYFWFFYVYCLLHIKKTLHNFKSWSYSFVFSSRTFIVFYFCICCEAPKLRFIFFLEITCSSTICWNDFPFHIVLLWCYSSKINGQCLGAFYYISVISLPILIPIPYVLNHYSFRAGFEVRQCKFTKYSSFSFFLRFLLVF